MIALAVLAGAAISAAVDVQPVAPDLLGWAAVITAVGVTFGTIVTSVVLVTTRRTERKVTLIDHAVNGQPPGTKPMVAQVQDLHAQIPVPLDDAQRDQLALLPLMRHQVALTESLVKAFLPAGESTLPSIDTNKEMT